MRGPHRGAEIVYVAVERGEGADSVHLTAASLLLVGEVPEDVVTDALDHKLEIGVVAARVGVVVPDDGEAFALGREVVLNKSERELERGEQRQVVRVVGQRHGVDDGDDGGGGGGLHEAADEEAVDGGGRVLERVQRELDVRRLRHLYRHSAPISSSAAAESDRRRISCWGDSGVQLSLAETLDLIWRCQICSGRRGRLEFVHSRPIVIST